MLISAFYGLNWLVSFLFQRSLAVLCLLLPYVLFCRPYWGGKMVWFLTGVLLGGIYELWLRAGAGLAVGRQIGPTCTGDFSV